jgi:hypothetical protein
LFGETLNHWKWTERQTESWGRSSSPSPISRTVLSFFHCPTLFWSITPHF